VISVSARAPGKADEIEAVEIRIAAILAGNVAAEPGIELVTDAKAEDAGAVETQALA
jgi:hypothetical protein